MLSFVQVLVSLVALRKITLATPLSLQPQRSEETTFRSLPDAHLRYLGSPPKRDMCTSGSWQCSGTTLQECDEGSWINVAVCTGTDIVCSSTSPFIGCLYSWQITGSGTTDISASTSVVAGVPTLVSEVIPSTIALSVDASLHLSVTAVSPSGTTGLSDSSTVATTTTGATPTSLTVANYSGASTTSGASNATSTGAVSFSAPHYAIYADASFSGGTMPTVAELGHYNRLILAFYIMAGAWDNVYSWTQLDSNTRSATLEDYHAGGIALMMSCFGSTDEPATSGADPVTLAQTIAAFAIEYQFDGVDVDFEDFASFSAGTAAAWLISFHTELRSQLGDGYLISYAPVAPWFDGSVYSDGAYETVFQKAGSTIDFFNIQYYNQYSAYTDCTSLVTDSSNTSWPGTSLNELNSELGIPFSKLVLGKPIDLAGESNGGYMDPSALAVCVAQAEALGWNGGVFFWEWTTTLDPASVLATVLGL